MKNKKNLHGSRLASYGERTHTCEGCIRMRGLGQVKEAQKLLSDSGLTVGEWTACAD